MILARDSSTRTPATDRCPRTINARGFFIAPSRAWPACVESTTRPRWVGFPSPKPGTSIQESEWLACCLAPARSQSMSDSLPPSPEQIARNLREIAGFLTAIAAQAPGEQPPPANSLPANSLSDSAPPAAIPPAPAPACDATPPGVPPACAHWSHALTALVPEGQQAAVRDALANPTSAVAPHQPLCSTSSGDATAVASDTAPHSRGGELPPTAEVLPAI